MKFNIAIFLIFIALVACKPKTEELNAQKIVDLAIETSGTENFRNSIVSFNFRNKKYTSQGNCEDFVYSREFLNLKISLKDVFRPQEKLKRYVRDTLKSIPDSTATKYAESINSVIYFVQLPFRLNDDAVNKTYKGQDSIKGKAYHKIAVNFDQKGGGTDYQDNYLYWFNVETYKLEYLAYSFVVNGGGIRFREAYNERYIEGIRFVDYKNYKPKTEDIELENIAKAFEDNDLKLLSTIENNTIKVELLNKNCD